MTDSFSESFVEARHKFLTAARAAGATCATYGRDDLTGRDGEYLACDVAILGAPDAPAAALVVSGTHGSEGYCGSAIQHRWLCDRSAILPDGVRIVFVHAINPWAFSHKTRATENNVDLNRNFLPQDGYRGRRNAAYDRLAAFLHAPAGTAEDHIAAYRGYRACIEEHGPGFEAESFEGQGTWPEGIFYTGTAPEWSNVTFRRIVGEHLSSASRIGFIDWHTCMGLFGETVTLLFDEEGSEEFRAATHWWGLGEGGGSAFRSGAAARYKGLLCQAIRQELSAPAIAGAVIEFGTVDDYAVFRADRLDRWLRFEGRSDPDRDRLREDYMNVCCPVDIAWRRYVLARGPERIDQMLAGLPTWR